MSSSETVASRLEPAHLVRGARPVNAGPVLRQFGGRPVAYGHELPVRWRASTQACDEPVPPQIDRQGRGPGVPRAGAAGAVQRPLGERSAREAPVALERWVAVDGRHSAVGDRGGEDDAAARVLATTARSRDGTVAGDSASSERAAYRSVAVGGASRSRRPGPGRRLRRPHPRCRRRRLPRPRLDPGTSPRSSTRCTPRRPLRPTRENPIFEEKPSPYPPVRAQRPSLHRALCRRRKQSC